MKCWIKFLHSSGSSLANSTGIASRIGHTISITTNGSSQSQSKNCTFHDHCNVLIIWLSLSLSKKTMKRCNEKLILFVLWGGATRWSNVFRRHDSQSSSNGFTCSWCLLTTRNSNRFNHWSNIIDMPFKSLFFFFRLCWLKLMSNFDIDKDCWSFWCRKNSTLSSTCCYDTSQISQFTHQLQVFSTSERNYWKYCE